MTTPSPEGVIARYLTLVGTSLADPSITVDVIDDGTAAICRGCGNGWSNPDYSFAVRQWAQAHAETCRAMPQPADDQ